MAGEVAAAMLEPIEAHLRAEERLDAGTDSLAAAGFELLPTFGVPHYSVVLRAYTEAEATRLLEVLGPVPQNPHFVDIVAGPSGRSIVHLDVLGVPEATIDELRHAQLLPS
jgi:hypothetical protein